MLQSSPTIIENRPILSNSRDQRRHRETVQSVSDVAKPSSLHS